MSCQRTNQPQTSLTSLAPRSTRKPVYHPHHPQSPKTPTNTLTTAPFHSPLRASAPAWFPPGEPATPVLAPIDTASTPAPAVDQATTATDNLAAVAVAPASPPVEERVWRFRSASDLCAFSAPPSPPAEEGTWNFAERVWRRVVVEDGGVAWRL